MRIREVRVLAGLLVLGFSVAVLADVAYRPESKLARTFIDNVSTAEIAVFPTIVRTPYLSRFSTRSQGQVIAFLQNNNLGNGVAAETQFYVGKTQARSQFDMFQNSMREIGKQLAGHHGDADYAMVIEVVFPPVMSGQTQVFGIHLFLLDQNGDNVFSFLMNSHHRAFAEAELKSWKDTAESKEKLAIKSTNIALAALKQQVAEVRSCLRLMPASRAEKPQRGVLVDFNSALPQGTNTDGVPMGFSTFNDAESAVSISTTADYPARPGAVAGNKVLELDVDATAWAGFAHTLTNAAANVWLVQDWSDYDGFGFLFHGNDSGTALFVDVLDNRGLCSRSDDAERFVYGFVDDSTGWRRITFRFADMVRKEIGNDAPNDGLGLTDMHGWAFGTGKTDGAVVFYIDDVELLQTDTPAAEKSPGFVQENRLDDSSSTLYLTLDESGRHVWQKSMDIMCACVDLTTSHGFRFFTMDRQTMLADGRGSLRIRYFDAPPANLQLLDLRHPADVFKATELQDIAFDATEFGAYCTLFETGESRDPGGTQ